MFEDITPKDIIFICTAIGSWCLLGIVILKGFLYLQIQERDTPFPEETGQTPESLDIGRGGMNGARPTRKKFSRLVLYSDFFVAGFKAQRVALPYSAITSTERYQRGKQYWVRIKAIQPDTEKSFDIYFYNSNVDTILEGIQAKL